MQRSLAIMFKVVFGLMVAALAAAVFGVYSGRIVVPEEFNPWAPLRITEAPGFLTPFKLKRATADAQLCQVALEDSGLQYQQVPDRETGQGCGFSNTVRISGIVSPDGAGKVAMTPFLLSCRAAVSVAMWEQHVVQPAAQLHFSRPVTGLDHLGSYACRNIYHRDNASRSQHATADALDVAGFRIAGGGRVSVLRDWPRESAEARFLHDVHSGACKLFDGVLGPDYNAAHRDHFHLDRGRHGVCR